MVRMVGAMRLLCAGVGILWCSSVGAEVLFECGESRGYGYYLQSPFVPAKEAGWHEDGITGGGINLLRDGGSFDIVYTDTVGSRSATADGGRVILLSDNPVGYIIIVGYAEVTETYLFSKANREVAWTQTKAAGLVDKVAAYRAACR